MLDSRLYYGLKETQPRALKFSYYTAEIDVDTSILKSHTITINQQDVLLTLDNIGINNLLFNINEAEYARFLKEVKEYKDYIEELSRTDIFTANTEFAKLWGPNELQRKFTEWFTNNGYNIPKIIIKNKDESMSAYHTKMPYFSLSKLNFEEPLKKLIKKVYPYKSIHNVTLLVNFVTIYYKKLIFKVTNKEYIKENIHIIAKFLGYSLALRSLQKKTPRGASIDHGLTDLPDSITRLRGSRWKSYKDAKIFAHKLKLSSSVKYKDWYRGTFKNLPPRPLDIPSSPRTVYKDDWKGWADYLGPSYYKNKSIQKQHLSFNKAKKLASSLEIISTKEWSDFIKSEAFKNLPEDFPLNPPGAYRNNPNWKGMPDFLGYK